MTEITLSIEEIQIAYDAVDNTPQLELTKHPILNKLDVESLQEEYVIELDNAEFEHIRIAIGHAMTQELNITVNTEMMALYNRLMEHRRTLL